MLHYNITALSRSMTVPHHHPHRIDVSPSLLRASAWQRLLIAAVVIAVLWVGLYEVIA